MWNRSIFGPIAAVALFVFLIDRFSKIWVVEIMDLRSLGRISVLDPFLTFQMAWNEGINFGLLDFGDAGKWVLIAVAVVIVAALLWWMRGRSGWLAATGAGLVTGGALGNVWDRVEYGAVADFLNMSCCGVRNPFSFNIADAAIFLGVVLLFFLPQDESGDHGDDANRA